MVAIPQNIITQALNVPHEPRLAQLTIGAMDLAPDETLPWANDMLPTSPSTGSGGSINDASAAKSYLALQYWPESITDTRSSEWNPRNIPGGSHPIYQWTHGGERKISFTAVFSTDTAVPDEVAGDEDPYFDMSTNILAGIQKGSRDLDIRASISWLRYFTYPKYALGSDLRAYEPPKCILVMPNMGIGYDGSDYIVAMMTQSDITYEAAFPNGVPRLVEMQLEFTESIQYGGRVRFHDRGRMTRSKNLGSYLKPRSALSNFRGG